MGDRRDQAGSATLPGDRVRPEVAPRIVAKRHSHGRQAKADKESELNGEVLQLAVGRADPCNCPSRQAEIPNKLHVAVRWLKIIVDAEVNGQARSPWPQRPRNERHGRHYASPASSIVLEPTAARLSTSQRLRE